MLALIIKSLATLHIALYISPVSYTYNSISRIYGMVTHNGIVLPNFIYIIGLMMKFE